MRGESNQSLSVKMPPMATSLLRTFRTYFLIVIGSLLTALGLNLFLVPNRIAAGGVTGFATVLYHLFGFPVGITSLALNLPLFGAAVLILGRSFGFKTLFSTILLSVAIDATAFLEPVSRDLLLCALFGGGLSGLGLGLVFRQNATTGGTDLLARIMHRFVSFISIGQWLLVADLGVAVFAMTVFKNYELGLYALVALFVNTWVVDSVLLGVNYTKAAYIISDHSELISGRLLQLPRGVTALKGQGTFTGKDKNVLLCVLRKREIMTLRRIVSEVDPDAFIFITDAREVFGEGFTPSSQ